MDAYNARRMTNMENDFALKEVFQLIKKEADKGNYIKEIDYTFIQISYEQVLRLKSLGYKFIDDNQNRRYIISWKPE